MVDVGHEMLQLENQTPFDAGLAVLPDPDGVDTLYVAVRATFALDRGLSVAPEQARLRAADEPWGDPESTSLRYAGEIHLLKPATDVVLVGHAWAPGGRPIPMLDVALAVGPVRKVIRVFGDREWRGTLDAKMSAPAPFERMPLRYERAFGGILEVDPITLAGKRDPRNPVGTGFARSAKSAEPTLRKLPNLEDPAQLIARPTDCPRPAGFGFIAPSWEPRRHFAGTYDARWREARAPYLPLDFQPSFFNAAHPDLVCTGHLQGGEELQAMSVSPAGLLRFRLPVCRFDAQVHIAGRIERPPLNLETVLVEPDEGRLGLLFRGAVRCDKSALRISRVRLGLAALQIEGRAA